MQAMFLVKRAKGMELRAWGVEYIVGSKSEKRKTDSGQQ